MLSAKRYAFLYVLLNMPCKSIPVVSGLVIQLCDEAMKHRPQHNYMRMQRNAITPKNAL